MHQSPNSWLLCTRKVVPVQTSAYHSAAECTRQLLEMLQSDALGIYSPLPQQALCPDFWAEVALYSIQVVVLWTVLWNSMLYSGSGGRQRWARYGPHFSKCAPWGLLIKMSKGIQGLQDHTMVVNTVPFWDVSHTGASQDCLEVKKAPKTKMFENPWVKTWDTNFKYIYFCAWFVLLCNLWLIVQPYKIIYCISSFFAVLWHYSEESENIMIIF